MTAGTSHERQTAYFDYTLPESLVAHHPISPRDHSRLLVVNRRTRTFSDHYFYELPTLLDEGDQLAINTTKVIPARLITRRRTGATIEVLLVEAVTGAANEWAAMVRSAAKLTAGESLILGENQHIRFLGPSPSPGLFHVKFEGSADAKTAMAKYGRMPLPPYIQANAATPAEAMERYQSVFAETEGAIAAPTASLHFTPELLHQLRASGHNQIPVTLHVGIGTFKPVQTDTIDAHVMHSETYSIPTDSAAALTQAIQQRSVVAVGTTVVRTLESAFRNGAIVAGTSSTNCFITPGHEFRTISKLITNFHLPKSTLLMLVSAFADRDLIMAAYQHAIEKRYRFFSYGDAMLIL